jgi:ankyrin repeat protein
MLLTKGADVTIRTNDGDSAIDLAAVRGHIKIMDLIQSNIDKKALKDSGIIEQNVGTDPLDVISSFLGGNKRKRSRKSKRTKRTKRSKKFKRKSKRH